jgi:hypothetical protein
MRSQQLVTVALALVALGIVFSENQLIGYLFIGTGVLLSIITAFKLRRKTRMLTHRTGGV